MKIFQLKSCNLRLLVQSALLLWALVLSSQEAFAYSYSNTAFSSVSASFLSVKSLAESEELTLQQAFQFISEDASTSSVTYTLQQAAKFQSRYSFKFPVDEAIPPYAARAPGASALSKFFPTSIQPHAP